MNIFLLQLRRTSVVVRESHCLKSSRNTNMKNPSRIVAINYSEIRNTLPSLVREICDPRVDLTSLPAMMIFSTSETLTSVIWATARGKDSKQLKARIKTNILLKQTISSGNEVSLLLCKWRACKLKLNLNIQSYIIVVYYISKIL